MTLQIRLPEALRIKAIEDLDRAHPFASERVGFFSASIASSGNEDRLVVFTGFHSIPDDEYEDDPRYGAVIGSKAILASMQRVLDEHRGQFHVHLHHHTGAPKPSRTDRSSLPRIVRSLKTVGPLQASGYIILSRDGAWAEAHVPGISAPQPATRITVTGFPIRFLL